MFNLKMIILQTLFFLTFPPIVVGGILFTIQYHFIKLFPYAPSDFLERWSSRTNLSLHDKCLPYTTEYSFWIWWTLLWMKENRTNVNQTKNSDKTKHILWYAKHRLKKNSDIFTTYCALREIWFNILWSAQWKVYIEKLRIC